MDIDISPSLVYNPDDDLDERLTALEREVACLRKMLRDFYVTYRMGALQSVRWIEREYKLDPGGTHDWKDGIPNRD